MLSYLTYSQKLSICRKLNRNSQTINSFGYRCSCFSDYNGYEYLELYDSVSLVSIDSCNCKKWDERTIIEWFHNNCLILYKTIRENSK